MKKLSIVLVCMLSCLWNVAAEERVIPHWKQADVVFEGEIVQSQRITGYASKGVIVAFDDLKPTGDMEKDLFHREVWMDILLVKKVYKGNIRAKALYPIFYEKRPLEVVLQYKEPILGKKVIGEEIATRKIFFIVNEQNDNPMFSWKLGDKWMIEYEQLPDYFKEFLKKIK